MLPTCGPQSTEGKSRSEEHTSELQSRLHLVCRLLLEKKKINMTSFSCFREVILLPSFSVFETPFITLAMLQVHILSTISITVYSYVRATRLISWTKR